MHENVSACEWCRGKRFPIFLSGTIQIKAMKESASLSVAPPVEDEGKSSREVAPAERVVAIDILRALTMILMIFVNDLWSLKNIPAWLGHVDPGVDGIGLSDVIFPAFLFIVGLSLPYSVDNRRRKGDTDGLLIRHVLWRTIALLIMGVFLVNGESLNADATGFHRLVWNTVCCVCFILIWNSYPVRMNKAIVYTLRAVAILTLIAFAFVYRGGSAENVYTFGPRWWGILGLIGWAYLVAATTTVFARNRIAIVFAAWVFFALLSMLSHAGLVPEFLSFIPDPILGGTLTGLTMGGVLAALVFRHYRQQNDNRKLTLVFLAAAFVLVILSVITRPYWGLAKLGATPAWLFLCSAFTILGFLTVYWFADVGGKERWFAIIKPAGTATLLCYLIPYFAYTTTWALGVRLSEFMLTGGVGLLKSFLFALLCAGITGALIRAGLRFKV
jgi:heparan-alpha-glucosaminide N-acetyltransferase